MAHRFVIDFGPIRSLSEAVRKRRKLRIKAVPADSAWDQSSALSYWLRRDRKGVPLSCRPTTVMKMAFGGKPGMADVRNEIPAGLCSAFGHRGHSGVDRGLIVWECGGAREPNSGIEPGWKASMRRRVCFVSSTEEISCHGSGPPCSVRLKSTRAANRCTCDKRGTPRTWPRLASPLYACSSWQLLQSIDADGSRFAASANTTTEACGSILHLAGDRRCRTAHRL